MHIHTVSALNHCGRIFSKPSAIRTKCCAQTFPPIFGLFAIFDRNLAKIVAPPSDECETYVACLKVQSLPKKTLQAASKSAYKWQRNACSNYAPLERTALRTRSVTNKQKKQTPHFGTYSRRASYDLPQTLHGDRARRVHQKGGIHFSIQRIVFPTGCTEKFGLIYRRAVSPQ